VKAYDDRRDIRFLNDSYLLWLWQKSKNERLLEDFRYTNDSESFLKRYMCLRRFEFI
jgi:hypothetical protein